MEGCRAPEPASAGRAAEMTSPRTPSRARTAARPVPGRRRSHRAGRLPWTTATAGARRTPKPEPLPKLARGW